MTKTLSRYTYTGALIRNYAKSLTQLNSVLNPAKYLPQNWVDQPSNQNYFDMISKLLIKLNKRIFVIIDDIDRLDNDELFEVLRMIRNSANFPNTVFLVPFDKSYAMHAMTEKKIYNPQEYLKKIFDVEVSLTPIHESYLQPVFLQVMGDFIKNKLALHLKYILIRLRDNCWQYSKVEVFRAIRISIALSKTLFLKLYEITEISAGLQIV